MSMGGFDCLLWDREQFEKANYSFKELNGLTAFYHRSNFFLLGSVIVSKICIIPSTSQPEINVFLYSFTSFIVSLVPDNFLIIEGSFNHAFSALLFVFGSSDVRFSPVGRTANLDGVLTNQPNVFPQTVLLYLPATFLSSLRDEKYDHLLFSI